VGDALDLENSFGDWRLVSLRVAPCSPFGVSLALDPDQWCWPELRLVWQPVQRGVYINGRVNRYFADDRAVHALYDIDASTVLPSAEAAEASALLARLKAHATGGGSTPSSSELARFAVLRDAVARAYLRETLALRDSSLPSSDYATISSRPEYGQGRNDAPARAFRARLVSFLSKHAPTRRLKELTAFSLPEGRQPPLLDEWVFLQFEGIAGRIVQRNIELRSSRDGRLLFDFGPVHVGSQRRDDPLLQTALDNGSIPPADRAEIEESVLLLAGDARSKGTRVADRRRTLVPNTSCASCHKLNGDPFDFHNLSYLDDRDMAVTPRVARDVELDLAWIRARGL
jgi:hypothetical protein